MRGSDSRRLVVLDVFRGAAVAGMILVTSPGDWDSSYAQLQHAAWNGWTLADMVFPAFLFAVGMAVGLSFPRDLSTPGARTSLWLRVGRRTVALIVLGLLLNALYNAAVPGIPVYIGQPGLAYIRIPGVLQRIALCYFGAMVLILATRDRTPDGKTDVNWRAIAATIAVLLVGYWLLMRFVPVPGFGVGRLDQEGNLAAYIDRAVFTPRHMWLFGSLGWNQPVIFDPEGLLSTLPALTNVLGGVIAGRAWRKSPEGMAGKLAIAGALLMTVGLLLDPVFPINKQIWTSSFALLSIGFSCLALALLTVALRSRLLERLSTPLRVLGVNAIFAYTISIILAKCSGAPWFYLDGQTVTAQEWGFGMARKLIPDPHLASLMCALAILAGIILLLWPLHRRAIHFRV
jgi:predicted acyltransferase